jgi:hypothetical protein
MGLTGLTTFRLQYLSIEQLWVVIIHSVKSPYPLSFMSASSLLQLHPEIHIYIYIYIYVYTYIYIYIYICACLKTNAHIFYGEQLPFFLVRKSLK